ncbi:MAG: glycosyltransferase [Candidatus Omnitrophica bacterium]|nr:glycosyltransferase [Candidatus Omnitrophota bacterium]
MRIMQILPAMNIGGIERGVIDLVKYFKDRGVDNIVVSSGGRLVEELEKQGITHYKLPVHRKSIFSLLYIRKLREIIRKENIDIVHARSRVPAWISFFATRTTQTHFITTAHGVYKSPLSSDVMGWGKYVICPSKVVARHMKEQFGVSDEKIKVIPRWVDLAKFNFCDYQSRAQSNLIVSIGRISSTKGYEYLIEGFRRVVRFNPYFKLKIIGSADKSKLRYLDYLKSLVSRFSLNYNVEFIGFKKDIEDALSKARVLIAPSVIEESFGRVVIEAFACGVPVIASNLGGFKEIIEQGKDGILVEPKNSEAIGQAILQLVKDPQYAQRLTECARRKVERFYASEQCLDETKKVYESTISGLNILVVKISSLGDLILSFPSLKAIRQAYPKAKISLLTSRKYYSLLDGCPYVDKIITVEDNYKKFTNLCKLSKNLRRESFDYIIDFQNNHASHLISFLSFGRYSFGYSLRWGKLLSNRITCKRNLDPLSSQESILELLGVRLKEKKLIFWETNNRAEVNLPEANLIGINIAASSRWVSKNWPARHIVRLIELIQKNLPGTKVLLFGEEQSKKLATEIEAALKIPPISLCGKTTLGGLAQALRRLKVFITPDTATLHLAMAIGIPVVALFGPTDPSRHTVEASNLSTFCQKLPCSFCYKPKCKFSESSLCLEKITPQEVFNKLRSLFK